MPRTLKQKAAIQKQKVMGNQVKGMTAALKERYTQVMALYGDNVEQTINFKYQVGAIFRDAKEDPEIYGDNAAQLIKEALGYKDKDREPNRVELFADLYVEPEVAKIVHWHEQFPKAKGRITWSHLERLLDKRITNEEREEWFTQVCIQGWTCKELNNQIKRKYESTGHGSQVKQPDTKAGLLQKMNQPLEQLRTFYHKVWKAADNPAPVRLLNNLDDLDEDALTELYSLKSNIAEALDYLGTLLADMETIKLEEKWLAKLKEAPKEEAAPADESKSDDSEDDAEVSSLVDSVL